MPRYGSKAAMLRVVARGAEPILHPATGAVVGYQRELVAEFGIAGEEFIPRDDAGDPIAKNVDGTPFSTASIRGHFWDSESWQREGQYSDEDLDALLKQVEYFCERQPDMVWRLEDPVFGAPWPTFDTQSDKNAVAFAIEGGMVGEALVYARQQGREKVVSELEAFLAEQTDAEQAEKALTVS